MKNPYENLPEKAFWRPAVADKSMFDVCELWNPKFHIQRGDNIVTFGSCFAQHISKALVQRGFNWLCTEIPPFGLKELIFAHPYYQYEHHRTSQILYRQ